MEPAGLAEQGREGRIRYCMVQYVKVRYSRLGRAGQGRIRSKDSVVW